MRHILKFCFDDSWLNLRTNFESNCGCFRPVDRLIQTLLGLLREKLYDFFLVSVFI